MQKQYSTPSQDRIKQQIQALESKLHSLVLVRDSGLSSSSINQEIKEGRLELEKLQKSLKRKKNNAEQQQKHRKKCKLEKKDSAADGKKTRESNTPGRPRLEEEQPELLKTICDLALFGSAAHDRRQTDEIRSCLTLPRLRAKLLDMGFHISQSGLYLRLLPKRSSSLEGRRHVVTVPVKLSKAQNDHHHNHPDGRFCTSTIRNVDSLASILGPKQVAYISHDDKARVQFGIPAANKQGHILMHYQYRIHLPDHTWVMAKKHNLTSSVYGGIGIHPDGLGSPEAVSYSGPTYIAIRSGKHSESTAATYSTDFDRLLEIEAFDDIMKNENEIKPVVIMSVDGGPDENPQ